MTLNGSLMTLDDFGPIPCTKKSPPGRARTDPSVSLYYIFCLSRIVRPEYRAVAAQSCLLAVTGSLSLSAHTATVVCSPALGDSRRGQRIMRQVTLTLIMGDRRQNKTWFRASQKYISPSQALSVSTEARSIQCPLSKPGQQAVHNTFSIFSCSTNTSKL